VLWCLESQYQRIAAAETSFQRYVKTEKRACGILGTGSERRHQPNEVDYYHKTIEGLVHLEEFSKTFTRELTFEVACRIRGRQRVFDETYNSMPREIALKKVELALELDDFIGWRRWFRIAAEDMDGQFLEIRAARRRFFDCDPDGDHGCDIDLEKARTDEPIDWDINEPTIGPHARLDSDDD